MPVMAFPPYHHWVHWLWRKLLPSLKSYCRLLLTYDTVVASQLYNLLTWIFDLSVLSCVVHYVTDPSTIISIPWLIICSWFVMTLTWRPWLFSCSCCALVVSHDLWVGVKTCIYCRPYLPIHYATLSCNGDKVSLLSSISGQKCSKFLCRAFHFCALVTPSVSGITQNNRKQWLKKTTQSVKKFPSYLNRFDLTSDAV